jgi:hypothetical protein
MNIVPKQDRTLSARGQEAEHSIQVRYRSLVNGWRLEQQMGSDVYWEWSLKRHRKSTEGANHGQ